MDGNKVSLGQCERRVIVFGSTGFGEMQQSLGRTQLFDESGLSLTFGCESFLIQCFQ